MLKQIKTLGLSLVIGSMLVTSLPVNVYGAEEPVMTPEEFMIQGYELEEGDTLMDAYGHIYDHRGVHIGNEDGTPVKNAQQPTVVSSKSKPEDQLVAIYKIVNYGKCSKSEEKMLRQYFKYRKIKAAAKEAYKESSNKYEMIDMSYNEKAEDLCDLTDLFKGYNKMSEQRKKVIRTVFIYQYNKQVKFKSTIETCEECKNDYVTNKLTAMCNKLDDNNCGCKSNIIVPELTAAGAKAAYKRKYKDAKVTVVKDNDDVVILKVTYNRSMTFENVTKQVTFNKETRKIERINETQANKFNSIEQALETMGITSEYELDWLRYSDGTWKDFGNSSNREFGGVITPEEQEMLAEIQDRVSK